MVEELVVKENLTDKLIEAGENLLTLLDKEPQLSITAALWLYFPESNLWQLLLASPQVSTLGPREVYKLVLTALANLFNGHSILTLNDIRAVTNADPLVGRLSTALGRVDAPDPIHFNKNAVGGQYIEDAYIYRLP